MGAAAVASLGSVGAGLFSRAEAAEAAPALPWPYEKIDPQEAGKIAFDGWYKAFCSYGVASGILIPLQKKIGAPYT
ncbi:MAG: hypothetical protein AB1634_15085, partial [Thermodesulfobacteriota bacterium]